jgi:peptidoglycan/LPS O-acetylase OafA/YrhL
MIHQITAGSYPGELSLPGWHVLIEEISLILFGALVILMFELLLALTLLCGLIASLLLYRFAKRAGAVLARAAFTPLLRVAEAPLVAQPQGRGLPRKILEAITGVGIRCEQYKE